MMWLRRVCHGRNRDKRFFAPFLGGEGRKQTDGFIAYFWLEGLKNPLMGLWYQFSITLTAAKEADDFIELRFNLNWKSRSLK